MGFTSIVFIFFCIFVLLVYSVTPVKGRWLPLVIASYLFYSTFLEYRLLAALLFVTVVSYCFGIWIHRNKSNSAKRWLMFAGIIAILVPLIWFKYLFFFTENVNSLFDVMGLNFKLPILPAMLAVGVSYYVFQAISYVIDIYLEVLEPELHFGRYALSICFFPKLLQGPIERGNSILPQLQSLSLPGKENVWAGAKLFVWGAFKKIVIADRLATFVDPVYSNVHDYTGATLLLAVYLYAMQIYLDFSGYTDMALGIGRCFNICLTPNFNSPYTATSVPEFWRRWHISFSTWILDYIFKPLQFCLRDWTKWGTPFALLLTFFVSGIWHGASWGFIAWGLIHGLYLGGSVLFRKQRKLLVRHFRLEKTMLLKAWQTFATFHMVCFAWIFFRAKTFSDACYVAWNSVAGLLESASELFAAKGSYFFNNLAPGKSSTDFLVMGILLILVPLVGRMRGNTQSPADLIKPVQMPFLVKSIVFGVAVYLIIFQGATTRSFIYLQF